MCLQASFLRLLNISQFQLPHGHHYQRDDLYLHCVRLKVIMERFIVWDVTSCGLTEDYWHFGGTYCRHLHGREQANRSEPSNQTKSGKLPSPTTGAVRFSETSVNNLLAGRIIKTFFFSVKTAVFNPNGQESRLCRARNYAVRVARSTVFKNQLTKVW
jgi:hypothetical protein